MRTLPCFLVLALLASCTNDRDLCGELGLVPDPGRTRCVCPEGTVTRADGTGCDLPDGGVISFPDASVPSDAGAEAGTDAGSPAVDSGFDATATTDASPCVAEAERCDGADNDCDERVDEEADSDCAPTSACTVGACVAGRCVGVLIDGDGDGFAAEALGACGLDCDDPGEAGLS